jgi:hypothetical protein
MPLPGKLAMTMRRRITRQEQKLPPPRPDEALRHNRWEKVWTRFFRQLEQAAALLSPEEEQSVGKALGDLADVGWFDGGDLDDHGLCSPYVCWLQHLQNGWCRLPKLSPAAMKELVVAWSSPAVSSGVVCQSCGVEYPHLNYQPVFAACPGCASREWDWAHLIEGYDRAWKKLDGYVGSRIVRGVT